MTVEHETAVGTRATDNEEKSYETKIDGIDPGNDYGETLLLKYLVDVIVENADYFQSVLSVLEARNSSRESSMVQYWESLVVAQCLSHGPPLAIWQDTGYRLQIFGVASRVPQQPGELLYWLSELLYENRKFIYKNLEKSRHMDIRCTCF